MDSVTDALSKLNAHWTDVGYQLGIPRAVLSSIAEDYSFEYFRLRALVRFYLYRCPHPSWRDIIWTLDLMCNNNDYHNYHEDLKRVHAEIKPFAEKLTGQLASFLNSMYMCI